MIADSLTKTLPWQQHEEFLRQVRLEDISEQIQQEKRMETLRDQIKDSHKSADKPEETVFLVQKGAQMRGLDENCLYIDI